MNNPLLDSLMGSRKTARPSNPLEMVAEFRKFAEGMTPQKAEAEINRLLSSGQMSKEQFASLQEQAKMFAQFLR